MSGMARDDLDRRLAGFFEAASTVALPDGLLEDTYRVTRRIPQQRSPLARRLAPFRLWWSAPFGAAPRVRLVVLVAILLLALATSLVYVGSHYRRLPPPYGRAVNGLLVYDFNKQLFALRADGSSQQLSLTEGLSWGPTFSPDGTRFAFWSQPALRRPIDLWVANADGTDPHKVSGPFPMAGGSTISWSPDSARIAYFSRLAGESNRILLDRIYIANADGSGSVHVGPDDGGDRMYPMWSPRGNLLAYRLVRQPEGNAELAVMSPDGEGERTLVTARPSPGAFAASQWSADGTELVFFDKPVSNDFVGIVDLDRNVRPLSLESEDAYNPALSNDGRRVAYALRSGETVIVDLDSGERRSLPIGLAGCGVVWSPDDQYLIGLGDGCTGVLRFPANDPSAVEYLTPTDGEVGGVAVQRLAP